MAFLYFRESRRRWSCWRLVWGEVGCHERDRSPAFPDHAHFSGASAVFGKNLIQIAVEKAGSLNPTAVVDLRPPAAGDCSLPSEVPGVAFPLLCMGEDFTAKRRGPQVIDFYGRGHRWAGCVWG